MAFRTWWVEGNRLIIVQLRFQPMPIWISIDRMSIIVEIRDAKTGEAIEVWHMHMKFTF